MIGVEIGNLKPARLFHFPANSEDEEFCRLNITSSGGGGCVELQFNDLDDAAEWLRAALGQVEVAKIDSAQTPAKLADL